MVLLFAACASKTDDGKRNLVDEIETAKPGATIEADKFTVLDKENEYAVSANNLTIIKMNVSNAKLTVCEDVEDSFTLKDSTLDTLIIEGGKSVSIENCTIKNLIVKKDGVKVILSGSTKIEEEMKIEANKCIIGADEADNSIKKISLSASVKNLTIGDSDKSSLAISSIDFAGKDPSTVTITVKKSEKIDIAKAGVNDDLKNSIKDESDKPIFETDGDGNTGGNTGDGDGDGDGNTGDGNTGDGNTGDGNTGGNTGNGNTGGNTGDGDGNGNIGGGNTGDGDGKNPGGSTGGGDDGDDKNPGGSTGGGDDGDDKNPGGSTGDGNTGDGNTGDGNTGDGNTSDGNTGDGDGNGNTGDGDGDDGVKPLYLAGDMNSYTDGGKDPVTEKDKPRNSFTPVNENTQQYEFTYHDNMDAWGGGNGILNFRVCYGADLDDWFLDWGGENKTPVNLYVNHYKWLELKPRGESNAGPGSIVVNDLVEGETYIIEVDYDEPTKSLKIKMSGNTKDDLASGSVIIENAEWYYVDINVNDNVSDVLENAGMVVNNGGNEKKTRDTALPLFKANEGGVFYYTYDPNKNNNLKVSHQEDNPDSSPTSGTIRIYVYTSCENPYLHCWGGPFKESEWPGIKMTKEGEVAKPTHSVTMTITTIEVTGLKGLNDSVWLTGEFCGWKKPGEDDRYKATAKNGTILMENVNIVFSKNYVPDGETATSAFKFAGEEWGKAQIVSMSIENDSNFFCEIDPKCTTLKISCERIEGSDPTYYRCTLSQE